MIVGIMQPYFFPYLGYFQLIRSVDVFIIYDNIKYTKKGWINRNRYLLNGRDALFTIPLESGPDDALIVARNVSSSFRQHKLLNQIQNAYARAPNYPATFSLFERALLFEERNLFHYILNSIECITRHLACVPTLRVSSSIEIDHSLRGQDKVLALCLAAGATTYINPIGGTDLYQRDVFAKSGVDLKFLKTRPVEYPQFGQPFVPMLSILDVLMFNSVNECRALLDHYDLISSDPVDSSPRFPATA